MLIYEAIEVLADAYTVSEEDQPRGFRLTDDRDGDSVAGPKRVMDAWAALRRYAEQTQRAREAREAAEARGIGQDTPEPPDPPIGGSPDPDHPDRFTRASGSEAEIMLPPYVEADQLVRILVAEAGRGTTPIADLFAKAIVYGQGAAKREVAQLARDVGAARALADELARKIEAAVAEREPSFSFSGIRVDGYDPRTWAKAFMAEQGWLEEGRVADWFGAAMIAGHDRAYAKIHARQEAARPHFVRADGRLDFVAEPDANEPYPRDAEQPAVDPGIADAAATASQAAASARAIAEHELEKREAAARLAPAPFDPEHAVAHALCTASGMDPEEPGTLDAQLHTARTFIAAMAAAGYPPRIPGQPDPVPSDWNDIPPIVCQPPSRAVLTLLRTKPGPSLWAGYTPGEATRTALELCAGACWTGVWHTIPEHLAELRARMR